jgi:hypothetical protein
LIKETVVVLVYFVDKLVEVVFVTSTQVDEGLYCLVRVCGDLLPLAGFDRLDGVVSK